MELWLLNRTLVDDQAATYAADNECMTTPETSGRAELASRLMQAIDASATDFRTPQGLARELGVSESAVRATLDDLGARVRRPIGGGEKYRDWYRSSARPLTWRERWWELRALAGYLPGM
jgi:hypothetical protein